MKKLNVNELKQVSGGYITFDNRCGGYPWAAVSDDGLKETCFKTKKEAINCANKQGWNTDIKVFAYYLRKPQNVDLKHLAKICISLSNNNR